jgi:hypothetical protein
VLLMSSAGGMVETLPEGQVYLVRQHERVAARAKGGARSVLKSNGVPRRGEGACDGTAICVPPACAQSGSHSAKLE